MSGTQQFIRPYLIRRVYEETMSGAIDGVNMQFCTTHPYETGTITVYLNGLKLTVGSGNDFIEGPGNCITMFYAPLPGDVLTAEYNRVGV